MSSGKKTLTLAVSRYYPWRYQILMLFGVFAGAWAAILGRMAQEEAISTLAIIAFRTLLGATVLTPMVVWRHRRDLALLGPKDIFTTMVAGFWFATHLIALFASLEQTSVLVSSVLGSTAPLWIALMEVRLLGAKLNRAVWVGLTVTLLGGAIITLSGTVDASLGDKPLLGAALALTSAAAGSLYAIIGRRSRNKTAFLPYLWLVFVFAGLISLSAALVSGQPLTGYSTRGYVYLLLLTLFPQLIGHSIYNFTLRRLPATYVSVISQLGVVISVVLAFFIFRETPHALQLPGSLAVITGIAIVNLGRTGPHVDSAEPLSSQRKTEVI